MKDCNFLIVGVGGQGALLASNVIASVGIEIGYDVKKAEVHGMSQRGGSVNTHVRWSSKVNSPVIPEGEVDYLLSLEKMETLRYLRMIRPTSTVLIGAIKIPPLTVSSGDDVYPDDDLIRQSLSLAARKFFVIPTLELAVKAGSQRVQNVVLLGVLSTQLADIDSEVWENIIESQVPEKYVLTNMKAFQLGRDFYFNRISS